MNANLYYISETFDSIQGEGNCAGALSFFLRFQHCNLTCSWCDTKYTWNKKTDLQPQTIEEVKAIIAQSSSPNVIFTGGEPCLYRLDLLAEESKTYHVETNGTLLPTEALDIILPDGTQFQREAMDEAVISKFNWVVSPKMGNAKQQVDEKSLIYWATKSYCIFKFIIQNEEDITEVDSIVKKFNINTNKIYLGLEGNSLESQIKPELVDSIIAKRYNFSPRLHVLLWGKERKK